MQRETQSNSVAPLQTVATDPKEKSRIEAANGLRQFDEAIKLVRAQLGSNQLFILKPSLLLLLQRLATEGVVQKPGNFRTDPVGIKGTDHVPPPAEQVVPLVEQMCDYVNGHWNASPIHLAAYVLWRLNWIHPFIDGNGRTSRMISYVVLSIALKYEIPGEPAIPELISQNRAPYYAALDDADAFEKKGELNVSLMEQYLSIQLAMQLSSVIDAAAHPRNTGAT